MSQDRLTIVPITLREANAFVEREHRHHGRARGCKFTVGVRDSSGVLRGVAIVGRPVARMRDDGLTAEVTRLATDGCANACSALYAACWRTARAMGYHRLGTYILETEPGTSLVAAGWSLVGSTAPQGWNRALRPRTDGPLVAKQLWQVPA